MTIKIINIANIINMIYINENAADNSNGIITRTFVGRLSGGRY